MNKRKIVALSILSSGALLSSYLFFFANGGGENDKTLGIKSLRNANPSLEFDTVSGDRLGPAPFFSEKTGSPNLTDSLTKNYLVEISKLNPSGVDANGNPDLTLPSGDKFGALLETALKKDFEWNRVGEKDIEFSTNNSASQKIAYIKTVYNLLEDKKNNLGEELSIVNNFFEGENPIGLNNQLTVVKNQLNELLTGAVPSDNKSLHLQVVNAWKKQAAVYGALLGLNNDPLNAFLAVNEIPNLVEEIAKINLVVSAEYEKAKS